MVPRVPTEAMRDAGNDGAAPYMVDAAKLWAQMLAASPQPAPAPVQVVCNRDCDCVGECKAGIERATAQPPAPVQVEIAIGETIVVADLASKLGVKCVDVVKALFEEGIFVTVNQEIDQATADLVTQIITDQPPAPGEAELPPLPDRFDSVSVDDFTGQRLSVYTASQMEAYARAAIAALAQRRVPEDVRKELLLAWDLAGDVCGSALLAAEPHAMNDEHCEAVRKKAQRVFIALINTYSDLVGHRPEDDESELDQQQEARGNGE